MIVKASELTPEVAGDALIGRVILVTGATGSVGRAAAHAFAQHGATVVLHGRDATKLEQLYDEVEAIGGPAPAILNLDVSVATEADYRGVAETISASFRRLDGIFHALSHCSPLTPLAMQDLRVWNTHTTVNALAPIAITRTCLPMLKRAPSAAVVFLLSSSTLTPKAYWGAYSASKALLADSAAIWADELGADSTLKIRLFVPGPVASHVRAVTHPGEVAASLRQPTSFAPEFVRLMDGDDTRDTERQNT
jgi:NAD(P)-dependent dehydrogenase (short-subunit alcohol dehydrogenase family)